MLKQFMKDLNPNKIYVGLPDTLMDEELYNQQIRERTAAKSIFSNYNSAKARIGKKGLLSALLSSSDCFYC